MIKKALYMTTIVGLFGIFFFLILIAPYHIYTTTISEGIKTTFLDLNPSNSALFDGKENNREDLEMMLDRSLYENFHFNNFMIPLPLDHSIISLIPEIKIESVGPRLGANFKNSKNQDLFSFIIERPYKFETTTGNQKLFILPIFKNYILKKSNDEIWRDLFVKKLSLPGDDGGSFFASLVYLRDVSYMDLVYQLFILYNRKFLIPENTKSLKFDSKSKVGIIELPHNDSKYSRERLFIIEKGYVYPILITTRQKDQLALNFRTKFIDELKFKSSSKDSAIPIYAKYKQLLYSQRLTQKGMGYLYSAWSHDLDNKDYVRVIILFLERGKLNLKYLNPFYDFAYKKFGSTLSSESGYLNETASEALKRKIETDLENEISQEKNRESTRVDGQFNDPEEKIKYQLQKAKDLKINSDDSEKVLTIE